MTTQVDSRGVGHPSNDRVTAAPVYDLLNELDTDDIIQIIHSTLSCSLQTQISSVVSWYDAMPFAISCTKQVGVTLSITCHKQICKVRRCVYLCHIAP